MRECLPGQQHQPPIRPQGPAHVGQPGDAVTEEHRAGAADGDVKGRLLERVDLGVRLQETDVAEPLVDRPPPRHLEHGRRQVDPERAALRRASGGVAGGLAGTATDVEDPFVRLDGGRFHERRVVGRYGPVEPVRVHGPVRALLPVPRP